MNTIPRFSNAETLPNGTSSSLVYRPARMHQTGPKAVNLLTAEFGVTLFVGQELALELDSSEWNLRVRDGQLLSQVTPSTFRALARGKTRIYATRDAAPIASGADRAPRKLFIEIPIRVDE